MNTHGFRHLAIFYDLAQKHVFSPWRQEAERTRRRCSLIILSIDDTLCMEKMIHCFSLWKEISGVCHLAPCAISPHPPLYLIYDFTSLIQKHEARSRFQLGFYSSVVCENKTSISSFQISAFYNWNVRKFITLSLNSNHVHLKILLEYCLE